MSDPSSHVQHMLANIQSQIAAISSIAGQIGSTPAYPTYPLATTPAPINQQPSQQDLVQLIREVIKSERLVDITPATTALPTEQTVALPAPQPEQIALPAPKQESTQPSESSTMQASFLLPILGTAFTKEQQLWISQPSNLMGLASYITTTEGKAVMNYALEAYQKYQAANAG